MIPFILITAIQVYYLSNMLTNERKNDMKRNVQIMFGVLSTLNEKELSGELSKGQAQNIAKSILNNVRFEPDGYYWTIDTKGTMVIHPFTPHLNGKDLLKIPDPSGARIWVEAINTAKNNGEGFITYQWSKPGSSVKLDKTSFVRIFEPWGWIVGTGVYHTDVDIIVKESVHDNVFIGIVTLLLSILIISYILNKNEMYFYEKYVKK
jgi:methyl-accepting chemotaxis protein